jgi:hypothetical protein
MSSAGVLNGRCRINLYRLQGFGINDEVWEVIAVEREQMVEKLHFFRDNCGPVPSATGLRVAFQSSLQLLLQLYQVYLQA